MEQEFALLDEQDSIVSQKNSKEDVVRRPSWHRLLEVEFAKQNVLLQSMSVEIVTAVKETLKEELLSKSPTARAFRHVRTDVEMPKRHSRVSDSDPSADFVAQSLPLGMKFGKADRQHLEPPPEAVGPAVSGKPSGAAVSSTNSWDSIYQHRDFKDSRKKAQAAAEKISQLRATTRSSASLGRSMSPGSDDWPEYQPISLIIVRSSWFRAGVQLLILANLILLGVEVDASAHLPPNTQLPGFDIANSAIVCCFFGEILLKLHAYGGRTMFCGKDKWWNWSDVLIISMSIFEIVADAISSVMFAGQVDPTQLRTMRFLRMVRALRGVRVIRLLQYLSALRTIVFSIMSTMGSVFWTSLLLVILFYLFGVLNTQIVTDYCRALRFASEPQECDPELLRFWASVPQSMLTLFLSITNGIGWDECLQPLWGVSSFAIASLIIYIVITVLAVLNTVTGVFCNMAIESARADKDMATMRQMQKHEAQVDALRGVFEEINPDGMSVISLDELKEALQQQKLRSFLHSMDIATDDIVTLFMVIDADGSGDITVDEFVYGCMNLAGPAKQLQVARMGYENSIIRKEIKALRVDLRKMRHVMAVVERSHPSPARAALPALRPLPESFPTVRV